MSDIVERARGLLGGVNAERGQWEAHCYHAFAFIGNADFAAAAPQLVADLATEVERLRGIETRVAAFLGERDNFITAIKNCPPGNKADYWRWQGNAEARRVLAEDLKALEADHG